MQARQSTEDAGNLANRPGRTFQPHETACPRPQSQERAWWDFPGGPVVKTLPSNAGGEGSIPGGRAKIPHALQPKNQNIKQKQYCNKFNKDF